MGLGYCEISVFLPKEYFCDFPALCPCLLPKLDEPCIDSPPSPNFCRPYSAINMAARLLSKIRISSPPACRFQALLIKVESSGFLSLVFRILSQFLGPFS